MYNFICVIYIESLNMWPWLVQSSVRRTCDSSRVSRVIRTGFHVTCTHKPVFYIHSYCVAAQQLRASCPHQLCCPVPLSFIGTCCSFCSFIISSNKLPQFPHSGSQLDSDWDRIKTYLLTKHWAEFSQSYLETYPESLVETSFHHMGPATRVEELP